MESSTEKTLHWNTYVIGGFLNLDSVLLNVANINSYIITMQPKVGAISFNKKVIEEFYVNHVVLRDSHVLRESRSCS